MRFKPKTLILIVNLRKMVMSIFKPNIEKLEKKSVIRLIVALKHKDTGIRMEAARAIGNICDTRAIEPLIQ